MRVFVVDQEPRLHIWAELSIPPCVVEEQATRGFRWEAFDLTPRDGDSRALTFEELLAMAGGRRAFERWRMGDDALRDERYETRRLEAMRAKVTRAALAGCNSALELIVSGLPDPDVEAFEDEHLCERRV